MTRPRAPSEKKYCVDCRSISLQGTNYAAAVCLDPRAQRPKHDLVSGELISAAPHPCYFARATSSLCGINARFFIAKD